jgi:hypothetical protein
MKRLSIVAASVLSLLGVGFLVAPSAHAAPPPPCSGIRVHLYLGSGPDILDICLPDDLLGP